MIKTLNWFTVLLHCVHLLFFQAKRKKKSQSHGLLIIKHVVPCAASWRHIPGILGKEVQTVLNSPRSGSANVYTEPTNGHVTSQQGNCCYWKLNSLSLPQVTEQELWSLCRDLALAQGHFGRAEGLLIFLLCHAAAKKLNHFCLKVIK